MRYTSWILSLFLHAAMAALLIQTVQLEPFGMEEFLKVDLMSLEVPEPLPAIPPPADPEPIPEPAPDPPEAPRPSAPLPMDKTIVLESPAAAPQPPPTPAPDTKTAEPLPPDVVAVSPVKVPTPPPAPQPMPEPRPDPVLEDTGSRIVLRKDDIIAHRGHEGRFGRTMMADYYSYSSSEFSGQFKARDRTISIIDARNTEYGRFLLYDSKHKTLRRLKESGKYVYTIGPSLYEDEPVKGVIIFLAKNDRIERFIMTSKDDRIARFPVKIHVREESVTIPTNDGMMDAYVSLPPEGKDHRGVVFVWGDRCVNHDLVLGFTRTLSTQGLASLSLTPRWCADGKRPADSEQRLVADTRAALSHFGSVAQVNFRHVGLWGNGRGIPVAIRAAHGGALSPAFVVCMVTDAASPADMPDRAELSRLDAPALWLVTGSDVDRWRPFTDMLESLRDKEGKRFTVVIAPTDEDTGMPDELMADTGWVESVTEDHARLAMSWIRQIDD